MNNKPIGIFLLCWKSIFCVQASPAAEPERADLHRVGEGSPHEHRRHRRHRSLQGGRHVSPHYSFDQGWARVPECVRVSRLYTFFKRCCVSSLRAHFCPLKKSRIPGFASSLIASPYFYFVSFVHPSHLDLCPALWLVVKLSACGRGGGRGAAPPTPIRPLDFLHSVTHRVFRVCVILPIVSAKCLYVGRKTFASAQLWESGLDLSYSSS